MVAASAARWSLEHAFSTLAPAPTNTAVYWLPAHHWVHYTQAPTKGQHPQMGSTHKRHAGPPLQSLTCSPLSHCMRQSAAACWACTDSAGQGSMRSPCKGDGRSQEGTTRRGGASWHVAHS